MKKEGLNTLDKTLLGVAIMDVVFVIAMIVVFCIFQAVPDILIASVFGATFGECGCCSYIWKTKRTTGGGGNVNEQIECGEQDQN